LDKTSVTLKNSGGISATYIIRINDDINNVNQSFEGQMFLKGTKYFFETPEQAVYFDGKTQWIHKKPYEEVDITEPNQQEIRASNPISIFDLYKADYDYKYLGEKTDVQKRKVHEISLLPKDKKEEIKQVILQINPNDFMPFFFHLTFKNGLEFRIFINKYQTKLTLPDSQFFFDKSKYPNVYVNDLR